MLYEVITRKRASRSRDHCGVQISVVIPAQAGIQRIAVGGVGANGAEPGAKLRRVGLLVNLPPPPDPVAVGFLNAVRLGLRDAGFVRNNFV